MTLFDLARDLEVPSSCRESGRCRECVVEVTAGGEQLSKPTEPERFLRPPFRLACQAEVTGRQDAVEFEVVRRRLRILVHDRGDATTAVDSAVTVENGVVRYAGESLGPVRGGVFGIALDLGTTTVVLELVDLADGRTVDICAFENPQRFGGSDVMTRISYDDGPNRGELRRALRKVLNHELDRLYAMHGLDRREVVEIVVVGNSTMRDLFFGLDVSTIGQRPYRSSTEHALLAGESSTTALEARAHELGLRVHPQARIWGAPLVASHVGADAAADLAALGIDGDGDEVVMLVDVGTNTEVVIAGRGRIAAASCPAGPAFEGGLVTYGMQATDGAIERVRSREDGGLALETIGGGPPVGICGSGLVDLLAVLRRSGRMTPLGVFADRAAHIVVDEKAGITLSRADASELAQAKAANEGGQWILLRHLGLDPGDVDRVYLAGGFASHVDVENAIEIGFLAPVPANRVVKVGNASVLGARRLLLSRAERARLDALVRRIEHVELETTPDFFEIFVEACQFKPMPSRLGGGLQRRLAV